MMALLIEQIGPDGAAYAYHRVAEVLCDADSAEAYAVVHSFPDATDAHLLAPNWRRTYRFARVSSDVLADAYARIKTLPEWAGAVDVP